MKALNVIRVIAAVILSIALVLALMAAPIISAAESLTKPKGLHEVVREIDFVQLVIQHRELRDTLEIYGVDGDFLDAIADTELTEDTVTAYIESLFENKEFTPDVLEEIMKKHREEVLRIFKKLIDTKYPQYKGMSDDELFAELVSIMRSQWDTVFAALPTAEDLGLTQEEYDALVSGRYLPDGLRNVRHYAPAEANQKDSGMSVGEVIMLLKQGTASTILIISIVVLSCLIFALRLRKFSGFLWLFIDYAIAAVFTIVLSLIAPPVLSAFVPSGAAGVIADAVFSVTAANILTSGVIILGLSVLYLAALILCRKLICKKHEN